MVVSSRPIPSLRAYPLELTFFLNDQHRIVGRLFNHDTGEVLDQVIGFFPPHWRDQAFARMRDHDALDLTPKKIVRGG